MIIFFVVALKNPSINLCLTNQILWGKNEWTLKKDDNIHKNKDQQIRRSEKWILELLTKKSILICARFTLNAKSCYDFEIGSNRSIGHYFKIT